MMITYLRSLCLIISMLFSSPCIAFQLDKLLCQAGVARYEKDTTILEDSVKIDHPLGHVEAGSVRTSTLKDLHNKPKKILLEHQVSLKLTEGASLLCDTLAIDCEQYSAQLSSGADTPFIIFKDSCDKNEDSYKQTSLSLKCHQMSIQIDPQALTQDAPHHFQQTLRNVVAEDGVEIEFRDQFIASGDIANFQRLFDADRPHQMPGTISIYSKKPEKECTLKTIKGCRIDALRLCIDTLNNRLCFAYPHGSLKFQVDKQIESFSVHFSCDTLSWESEKNTLTLCDQILIQIEGVATLESKNPVMILLNPQTQQPEQVICKGHTLITCCAQPKEERALLCFGTIVIDLLKGEASLSSPQDSQGHTIVGKQIAFQDLLGEIYADNATLSFKISPHESPLPHMNSIHLSGAVRLLNHSPTEIQACTSYIEKALADELCYNLESNEAVLACHHAKRVLLYDPVNHIQISAPKLVIHWDPKQQKTSIQGIGDVRFSFTPEEVHLFDHHTTMRDPA